MVKLSVKNGTMPHTPMISNPAIIIFFLLIFVVSHPIEKDPTMINRYGGDMELSCDENEFKAVCI